MSEQKKGEGEDGGQGGEGDKALTVPEVIWAAARWIAKRELLVRLGVVAFLLVVGGGAVVYAQGQGKMLTAPLELAHQVLEVRVTKLEQSEAARLEREAARDRITMETNLNVRLFLESQKIKPIDVPRFAADAGR